MHKNEKKPLSLSLYLYKYTHLYITLAFLMLRGLFEDNTKVLEIKNFFVEIFFSLSIVLYLHLVVLLLLVSFQEKKSQDSFFVAPFKFTSVLPSLNLSLFLFLSVFPSL